MRSDEDRSSGKFIFVFIIVVLVYCSFFNFNIPAAYQYAVQSVQSTLKIFGI